MRDGAVSLTKLIEQFASLPGIGRKTAIRLSFYIISLPKEKMLEFSNAIIDAHNKTKQCEVCKNYTDKPICDICADKTRDHSTICVVGDARDVTSFERMKEYNGVYHILGGLISPMDGISPNDIFIKELLKRCTNGDIREVIMATNPTIEGEATAMYIAKILKPFDIIVSRLAYGIAVGSDLEYTDEITLFKSLENRNKL